MDVHISWNAVCCHIVVVTESLLWLQIGWRIICTAFFSRFFLVSEADGDRISHFKSNLSKRSIADSLSQCGKPSVAVFDVVDPSDINSFILLNIEDWPRRIADSFGLRTIPREPICCQTAVEEIV